MWRLSCLFALVLFVGCSANVPAASTRVDASARDAVGGTDATRTREPDDGGLPDASSNAQVGADADAVDTNLPPSPREPLESLVDRASGVFRGSVARVVVDAAVDEFEFSGWMWRVHRDQATFMVRDGLGEGAGEASLVAWLIPTVCEAFDAEGKHVEGARLSLCTGRNEANSPVVGERMIGFVSGTRGGGLTFLHELRIDRDGIVDKTGLEPPPASATEDGVWRQIEERWSELGR